MNMRLRYSIAAMCLMSSTAAAQSGLRSASLPDRPPDNPIAAAQTLRSASLPDRTPTQPIPPPRSDRFLAGPFTYAPRPDRLPRHRHRGDHSIGYGYGYVPYMSTVPETDAAAAVPNGYLHLEMQPGDALVHVDGYYMGTVSDFHQVIPGRPLEAGPHRVEVRARGYETTTFDVRILPNETITYRSDLEADRASEPPVATAPAPRKTLYVIPGCYAGDTPPRAKALPRGCDRSKVRAIPPTIFRVKR